MHDMLTELERPDQRRLSVLVDPTTGVKMLTGDFDLSAACVRALGTKLGWRG